MNKDNNEIIEALIDKIYNAEFEHATRETIEWYVKETIEAKLKEVVEKIRLVEEIYIGMDGFVPQTAPEAYQQQTLKEMYDELKSIKETL